jgi:phosphohistidine phosphatase
MAGIVAAGGQRGCDTRVMATVRTLLVLRHSKSAYPEGVADFDRPLAPRGKRDAVAAGQWLRDQALAPDQVSCSVAERARQTWDLISDQLGVASAGNDVVRYDPRLYSADVEDLIGIIRETPAEVDILALVGHNPASADLVLALTTERQLSFPTSAIAAIEFRGLWAKVRPGSGQLASYWTPKGGTVTRRA